jgi:hypothetical protein
VDTGKQLRQRTLAPGSRSRLALTVVKAGGLGALVALSTLGGLPGVSSTAGSGGPGSVDEAYQRVVERAASDQRCAPQALGPQTHAVSALIRTSGGNVRVVSFEKGWDVYNGKRPGSLIAVCLEGLTG